MEESVGDVSQLTDERTDPFSIVATGLGGQHHHPHPHHHTRPLSHSPLSYGSSSPGLTPPKSGGRSTAAAAAAAARGGVPSATEGRSPLRAAVAPPELSSPSLERYEAEVLRVLEGLREECEAQKNTNGRLADELAAARADASAQRAAAAELRGEIAARDGVVAKLRDLMEQMPRAADVVARVRERDEAEARAEELQKMYDEAAALAKPLHAKLQEQDAYIAQVEGQLQGEKGTQEAVRQMVEELDGMKRSRLREAEALQAENDALQARLRTAEAELAELRAAADAADEARAEAQKDYARHTQSLLKLKDEQIKLAQHDTGVKEEQLQESRSLIQDMMGNVQTTNRRASEAKRERDEARKLLAEAQQHISDLEGRGEALKDTRKQVRREVQSAVAQAKDAEQRWAQEKKRHEEAADKQRAQLATLQAQRGRTEEALAEVRAAAKKAGDRADGLAAAVDRAHQQVCVAAAPAGCDASDAAAAAQQQQRGNAKQKLQAVIDRAGRSHQAATALRAQLAAARQEADEARQRCEEVAAHAEWLEGEWGAAKGRRDRVEGECRRVRDEFRSAGDAAREAISENGRLRERVAELEAAAEEAADALRVSEQRRMEAAEKLEAHVALGKRALVQQHATLAEAKVERGELGCLRERVAELSETVEELLRGGETLRREKEALAKEKDAAHEAKNKHQKTASRHLAELQKLRSDGADAKRRHEASSKTVEQLKKQLSIRESENKTLSEKMSGAHASAEKKEKELQREVARREAATKETSAMREELGGLIRELEALQRGKEQEEAQEVQRLRDAAVAQTTELATLRDALRDEAALRQQLDDDCRRLHAEVRRLEHELLQRPLGASATPARPSPHAGERAQQRKQLQHRQAALAGAETPYSVLHASRHTASSPRSASATSPPARTPRARGYATPSPGPRLRGSAAGASPASSYEPATEPRRLRSATGAAGGGASSPAAFDASPQQQKHAAGMTPSPAGKPRPGAEGSEPHSSVVVVGVEI